MGLLAEQKQQRRERIFEVARRLITEKGYDGLTMRDLADASGVSVPTLYNLCGSKNDLLFQAVAEEVDTTIAAINSGPGSRSRGTRRLLALLAVGHEEMSRSPAYYRALLAAAVRSEDARQPLLAVGSRLADELRDALAHMQASGELEPWVEISLLADRLRTICVWSSFEWASGSLTTDQVLSATRYDAALALLGAATESAKPTFERIVKQEQRALRTGPDRRAG